MGRILLDGLCCLTALQKGICSGLILVSPSFKFINKLNDLVEKYNNYESTNNEDLKHKDELKVIINEISENIESFQFNKSVAKFTNL